jgi:hypothetical protein
VSREDLIIAVAGEIADGREVEWGARAAQADDDSARVLRELQAISAIARLHRESDGESTHHPGLPGQGEIHGNGAGGDQATVGESLGHWNRFTLLSIIACGTPTWPVTWPSS